MTALTGTVVNGMVVFDGGQTMPDGTKVRVVAELAEPSTGTNEAVPPTKSKGTLAGLLKFAGKAEDLPADFAEQHDHYIHGTPRR